MNGRVDITNNIMTTFRENGETYGCGRMWERLQLSGSTFNYSNNTLEGCQGALVRHANYAFFNRRGVDGGNNAVGGSRMPIPEPSDLRLVRNNYTQGPAVRGFEDAVSSFLSLVDWLNNAAVELVAGQPFPTIKVSVIKNTINAADYGTLKIRSFIDTPITLSGSANARVAGNRISGRSGAAIALGQFSEDAGGIFDTGARIIGNRLANFEVIACDDNPALTDVCSTGTVEQREASRGQLWLGPNVSDSKVRLPKKDAGTLGNLASSNNNRIID